jgi:hypothetical protein
MVGLLYIINVGLIVRWGILGHTDIVVICILELVNLNIPSCGLGILGVETRLQHADAATVIRRQNGDNEPCRTLLSPGRMARCQTCTCIAGSSYDFPMATLVKRTELLQGRPGRRRT